MTLKVIVDTLDGMPPDVAKEYEERDDGKFVLSLEDDIRDHPKTKNLKVAYERTTAKLKERNDKLARLEELEAKLAEFPAEFNADDYAQDMDELEAFRTGRKKSKGGGPDPDPEMAHQKKLLEQRIATLEKKHGEEKLALETERATLIAEIERLVADEGLTKALVAVGVEKKLMPGATALLRKNVKVHHNKDNGEWTGFVETDLGETPIDEFVQTWAQSDEGLIYIAKAKGGDGKGSGDRTSMADNPFDSSNGKKPNLFKQQELIKANPEKARQLAQAVGVKPIW